MIPATQVKVGMVIMLGGTLCRVTDLMHVTPGKGRGMVQLKAYGVKDNSFIERRLRSDESIEVVQLDRHEMEFLYSVDDMYTFMDTSTNEQMELTQELLGTAVNYLLPNTVLTVVMYEGAPVIPDAGRFWKMIQQHKITVFYTAPTAIRALMKFGDDFPNSYDLSSLRLLGTVGEPINPEAWMWYHTVIGKERCPIVDTWWQTETGANVLTPIPGVTATKPGSCTLPLPGMAVDIVNEDGESITEPNKGGYLVITKPWPSMLRTIWGDDSRYVDTYFPKFGGK